MNVSEQQLGKRPVSIVVVAGYLLAFGIFRLVWQVPLVVHGHIPGMVSLTVFYLISGIVLLKRTWWARRVALATLVISTLDFAISAGHLAIGGVRLYAKGLLVALALILWNATMFFLLTKRSVKESFPMRANTPNMRSNPHGGSGKGKSDTAI